MEPKQERDAELFKRQVLRTDLPGLWVIIKTRILADSGDEDFKEAQYTGLLRAIREKPAIAGFVGPKLVEEDTGEFTGFFTDILPSLWKYDPALTKKLILKAKQSKRADRRLLERMLEIFKAGEPYVSYDEVYPDFIRFLETEEL